MREMGHIDSGNQTFAPPFWVVLRAETRQGICFRLTMYMAGGRNNPSANEYTLNYLMNLFALTHPPYN